MLLFWTEHLSIPLVRLKHEASTLATKAEALLGTSITCHSRKPIELAFETAGLLSLLSCARLAFTSSRARNHVWTRQGRCVIAMYTLIVPSQPAPCCGRAVVHKRVLAAALSLIPIAAKRKEACVIVRRSHVRRTPVLAPLAPSPTLLIQQGALLLPRHLRQGPWEGGSQAPSQGAA